jgi:hypothetical protein
VSDTAAEMLYLYLLGLVIILILVFGTWRASTVRYRDSVDPSSRSTDGPRSCDLDAPARPGGTEVSAAHSGHPAADMGSPTSRATSGEHLRAGVDPTDAR